VRRLGQLFSNLYSRGETSLPRTDQQMKIYLGAGIRKQRQVCRILEQSGWASTPSKISASAYAGWGRRKSGIEARELGQRFNKPAFALEDGFIRSVGLGQKGEPPISIIMDKCGIYYDATEPSWLEQRLSCDESAQNVDETRARDSIEMLRQARISKYNHVAKQQGDHADRDSYILIIDQTRNDPSITYGLADTSTFARMLKVAKYENPSKRILIKTHPGVTAGVAYGHFDFNEPSVEFVTETVNPWKLLENAEKVYTVSSGMGMEALLAGKKVRCFGMPFYAGWGLTDDELYVDRRSAVISLENLFSAAYLEYPTYYDPYIDEITTFERAVEILSFLRDKNEANKTKTICLGMSKWKQPSVSAFLRSTYQEPLFVKSSMEAIQTAKKDNARLVVWSSKCTPNLEKSCVEQNVSLLKMEDGFLRSNGLGSDLIPPLSLVLDEYGIYYDPTRTSRLEKLIEVGKYTPAALAAGREIRKQIVDKGLTKYNIEKNRSIENLPSDQSKKIILVPGQVADDASIRFGTLGSNVTSNLELLKIARRENSDAFIIYKPHPDVEAGNRSGRLPSHVLLQYADYIASDISTDYVIGVSDEVWTLTSLIGFEALLRGKKVVCFGIPFYAGWGLTTDRLTCERRTRRATLDEVFTAAYISYSSYIFRGLDGYIRMPAELAPAVLHRKNLPNTNKI